MVVVLSGAMKLLCEKEVQRHDINQDDYLLTMLNYYSVAALYSASEVNVTDGSVNSNKNPS